MEKRSMHAIIGLMVLITIFLATSCAGHHKKSLLGEWVRQETEKVVEDDGTHSEVKTVTSLNFKERKVTLMQKSYIDGESWLDISVSGVWDYKEPDFMGFVGSDAIGVISVTWDMDSLEFSIDYDFDINPEEIINSWQTYLENWNDETQKAISKSNQHSKLNFYYGYYLISVDDNVLVLEEDGETQTYTKER